MIYTFYSYKGGVGRSMALAGVAYLLAERGLRVLAIDFDLEAPGLERYYFEHGEAQRVRECPGLIDLILQYKRALTNQAEFELAAFRDWRKFVTEAVPGTASGGAVDLMPAGRRAPAEQLSQYARSVRSFDWQDFFDNWNGAQFFDWLRAQLTASSHGYDVVLVDSRTGVTEMGGVCAYQLADVAVMLCAANYQNLDGTYAVVRDFRSDAVLALRGGRPLELLVIPARLESTHPDRDQFFEDFERTFSSEGLPKVLADAGLNYRELSLPYDPAYAVIERLVGVSSSSGGDSAGSPDLAAVFGRLTDALTLLATDGKLVEQQTDAVARLRGGAPLDAPLPVADPTKRGAGSDVFLDCAPSDFAFADILTSHLGRAGLVVTRFDPEDFPRDWSEHIERALAYSQSLVVMFGESGTSPYRERLIRKARESRKVMILPVLIGRSIPFSVLASFGIEDRQALVLQDPDNPDSFAEIAARIRDFLSEGRESRADAPAKDPYPGGRPFGENDAPFFFGRDADIAALTERVLECQVVLLVGASGVGKTSLVQAGLISKLRHSESSNWAVDYLDLADASSAEFLSAPLDPPDRQRPSMSYLLVLDSADSFALEGSAAQRRRRLELVRDCVERESAHRKILVCVRGYWTEEERGFVLAAASGRNHIFNPLQPLTESALREIIVRPAQRQRHLFESGLIDRLITDAGTGAGALPVVQLALAVLWKSRRRGWLTNQGYDVSGGISGLVRANRDLCLQDLSDEERRHVTVFFSNLVNLDTRLALVPERRAWSELESIEALGPDCVALRDRLAFWRLIVIDSAASGGLACELAISDPASYLDKGDFQADFMLWRQRFSTYVHSWNSQRTLVQDPQLGEAELWYATRMGELTASERAVIEASQLQANKSQQMEEQQRALDRARELAKDAQTRLEEQHRALDTLVASGELRERANSMLTNLRGQMDEEGIGAATALIQQLHQVRDYEAMGLLVEAVSRHDPRNARNRRVYGQYFIETGRATAAIDVLSAVLQRLPIEDPESTECSGLLGRAYKQVFFETTDKMSEGARLALAAAIDAYRRPYEADPTHVWHGVNLLSLVDTARRLNLPLAHGLVPEHIARKLVSTLEQIPPSARSPWDLGALAEAYLGLRDWNAVERCVRSLILDPQTEAFHLASILRQFTEVWDLENSERRGRGLVGILRARLAEAPGARVEHDVREIGRLRGQQTPDAAQIESVLGSGGKSTLAWWNAGLSRAQSVASIRVGLGRVGTGFLVQARDLGLEGKETVLITAFHVLNEIRVGAKDSEIVFEAADPARIFRVEKILWRSSPDQHDACVVRLSPPPLGIEPLPIARTLPPVDGSALVYLVGHVGGRELTFSFQGNELLDHEGPPSGRPQIHGVCRVHYRAPTEAGSSGSPVFNANWEVIALHHKGAETGMPRLNGVAGTYAANEGISMQSIAEAIRHRPVSGTL